MKWYHRLVCCPCFKDKTLNIDSGFYSIEQASRYWKPDLVDLPVRANEGTRSIWSLHTVNNKRTRFTIRIVSNETHFASGIDEGQGSSTTPGMVYLKENADSVTDNDPRIFKIKRIRTRTFHFKRVLFNPSTGLYAVVHEANIALGKREDADNVHIERE